VLVNLLSNAVKFTERGEVVVVVDATPLPPGRTRLRLAVRDTGIGIPADRLDRLFRSFSQVDASTTRTYGGTGLGLAISRRLAEAMDGTLTVDSTPGQGSVFTLTVPLQVSEAPLARPPAPVELRGRSALVVDDNQTNRRILRRQLESWGVHVDDEPTGSAALRRVAAGLDYDVVLLDMHMPGMDGVELARRLRADPALARTPLVMLTSLGQRPQGAEALGLVHLTKPVKATSLQRVLQSVLGGATRAVEAPEQADLPPLRVLLAEDNPVNQRVGTLLLERLGQRPVVVGDGAEAVAEVARTRYDVVLMDVQMPVLDGLAATRRIRAELPADRQPHIVAMTANAMVEDREACLAAGMDDHVAKPVRLEELEAALLRVPGVAARETAPGAASRGVAANGDVPLVDHDVLSAPHRQARRARRRRPAAAPRHLAERERPAHGPSSRRRAPTATSRRCSACCTLVRGSSGSLGALRLSQACLAWEERLREGHDVACNDVVADLRPLVQQTAEAFRR
jgi:CheY-like chemotaxis protein